MRVLEIKMLNKLFISKSLWRILDYLGVVMSHLRGYLVTASDESGPSILAVVTPTEAEIRRR